MAEAQSTTIRRFAGVNRQVEPVFLGPQFLRASTNWIPDTTYLLTKRPGTSSFAASVTGTSQWTGLLRVYSGANRYLYGYRQTGAGDDLYVSTNDAAPAAVTSGTMTSTDKVGRLCQYGGYVYAGNGVDALKRITIGGSATNIQSVAAFTDSSAAPTVTSDTGASILTGTYSYCWAIYDHTNKLWVERGQARTVTNRSSGDACLSFPIVAGMASALGAQYKAHLFLAPVNYPIAFAHDHTPEGLTSGTTILRQLIADGTPVPLSGVDRTGNILVVHRNRLWVSGDVANPRRIYATSVLIPGAEQAIFDLGDFFPANAIISLPDDVTGMGVCATVNGDDPRSPMALFTKTSTYLWYGDILDDPSAERVQVSSRIGCIGADAVAQTPFGLCFIGLESVYRIPPGGGVPEDIGWPIAPAIKEIPTGSLSKCRLIFHKGFLKAYLVPSGASTPTVEYWCDLRMGLGNPPSWWGPHTGVAPTALATGLQDSAEFDRAWAALPSATGRIVLLHQSSSYADNGTTVISTLRTGGIDNGAPFASKTYALVRAIGKADTTTQAQVTLTTDGGQVWQMDQPLVFNGASGDVWDTAVFDADTWAGTYFEEVQTEASALRPRGLAVEVEVTHPAAVRVDLRDFDILIAPVGRPKRARGLGGTPSAGA